MINLIILVIPNVNYILVYLKFSIFFIKKDIKLSILVYLIIISSILQIPKYHFIGFLGISYKLRKPNDHYYVFYNLDFYPGYIYDIKQFWNLRFSNNINNDLKSYPHEQKDFIIFKISYDINIKIVVTLFTHREKFKDKNSKSFLNEFLNYKINNKNSNLTTVITQLLNIRFFVNCFNLTNTRIFPISNNLIQKLHNNKLPLTNDCNIIILIERFIMTFQFITFNIAYILNNHYILFKFKSNLTVNQIENYICIIKD